MFLVGLFAGTFWIVTALASCLPRTLGVAAASKRKLGVGAGENAAWCLDVFPLCNGGDRIGITTPSSPKVLLGPACSCCAAMCAVVAILLDGAEEP